MKLPHISKICVTYKRQNGDHLSRQFSFITWNAMHSGPIFGLSVAILFPQMRNAKFNTHKLVTCVSFDRDWCNDGSERKIHLKIGFQVGLCELQTCYSERSITLQQHTKLIFNERIDCFVNSDLSYRSTKHYWYLPWCAQ